MAEMTVREMRELLGVSQQGFSQLYGIPKRTIENWESEVRKCPEYVLNLLERAVKEDYRSVQKFDKKIEKQFEDDSVDGIINNRFL